MAKASLTCTTSWMSSTPLARTSSRRSASSTARPTTMARSSASLMRSSASSNKPSRSQSTLVTTTTTSSCASSTTNENGTMMLAELENFLTNLGDEIPKEDVIKLLDELADKEDEDGFIPYKGFLDRLCGKA